MVLEFTCDTHPQDANMLANNAGQGADTRQSARWATADYRNYEIVTGLRVQLKNGANTQTPNDPNNIRNIQATYNNNNNDADGRHESEEYYAFAKNRDRNTALFTADQKLQGSDSTKTRQNPGGTRRGLEVPEERDYFPYWRPTIWKPVAVFHNDLTECQQQMVTPQLAAKSACVPTKDQVNGQAGNANLNAGELATLVNSKTAAECTTNEGTWITQNLGTDLPQGFTQCVQNTWSQVNNLGNVKDTAKGGLPQNWDWTLPSLETLKNAGCYIYKSNEPNAADGPEYARLVTRMRYNMTTMDYAPYTTDASCNQNKRGGVQSPVEQNPTVDVGVEMQGLRLALNTAQTGRVFQDRSHVWRVMKTPTWQNAGGTTPGAAANRKVVNVNVQGKRGNIVQTFPAVEYDFWPKIVDLKLGDCAAFQWTGSNTHNNQNPGGDGQTGDAGEGRGGSDRHNLIQVMDKNSTYPAPYDKAVVPDFFANSKVYKTYTGKAVASGTQVTGTENPQTLSGRDAQMYFVSGGYYQTEAEVGVNTAGRGGDGELNVLLNNTPASMRGMTVCPEKVGTYEFTCTRNNNFSNRDQKLTINVSA